MNAPKRGVFHLCSIEHPCPDKTRRNLKKNGQGYRESGKIRPVPKPKPDTGS